MKPSSHQLLISRASAKRHFASLITAGLLVSTVISAEASGNMYGLLEGARVVQYATHIDISTLKGNLSIIEQQGHNNQASVIQSRSSSYQLANFSHIYQHGSDNLATVNQENGKNIGVVWQVGNNHTANISQQGNSLSLRADIYQIGFNSDISISQSGSGQRGVSVQQQNYSGNARPVTIETY